jgi:hypothetical protein
MTRQTTCQRDRSDGGKENDKDRVLFDMIFEEATCGYML